MIAASPCRLFVAPAKNTNDGIALLQGCHARPQQPSPFKPPAVCLHSRFRVRARAPSQPLTCTFPCARTAAAVYVPVCLHRPAPAYDTPNDTPNDTANGTPKPLAIS